MNYKPNPLLYGATEDFLSSYRIAITMCSEVDHKTLRHAVDGAMERYPYFCVYPEKQENSLRLCHNPHPVPVFDDGRSAVLGREDLHGHLLAFGCEGRQIYLHASHYIADGMGIDPLLKTVLYLYVSERYGTEGLRAERIQMPTDPVLEAEYAYPFPDAPFEIDDTYLPRRAPDTAFGLDPDAFDANGFYAYHLHVPQKALMEKANPSDGSPVSFLSVMLYRALCQLNEKLDHPVVAHVQHQYRALLNAPTNRHSLVSYVPVSLPAKMKDWQVMQQNTVVRGQILLGSEARSTACSVPCPTSMQALRKRSKPCSSTSRTASVPRPLASATLEKWIGAAWIAMWRISTPILAKSTPKTCS